MASRTPFPRVFWVANLIEVLERFSYYGIYFGFGVYMTQSPSDTLRSPIARALIEQTATFIFLPNPTADEADYVEGFKLTPTEFELLKGLGESSRTFLIKQGDVVSIGSFTRDHSWIDAPVFDAKIFGNLSRLSQLHSEFLEDLLKLRSRWPYIDTMGKIFLRLLYNNMEVYSEFSKNYPYSKDTLFW